MKGGRQSYRSSGTPRVAGGYLSRKVKNWTSFHSLSQFPTLNRLVFESSGFVETVMYLSRRLHRPDKPLDQIMEGFKLPSLYKSLELQVGID